MCRTLANRYATAVTSSDRMHISKYLLSDVRQGLSGNVKRNNLMRNKVATVLTTITHRPKGQKYCKYSFHEVMYAALHIDLDTGL